jgi:hypothetical protein
MISFCYLCPYPEMRHENLYFQKSITGIFQAFLDVKRKSGNSLEKVLSLNLSRFCGRKLKKWLRWEFFSMKYVPVSFIYI